ncbi:MAG: lipoyl(octanoyl) transferase LipB [Pseudomonadota bacterium]
MPTPNILIARHLGLCEYTPAWTAMREFTAARNAATPDEVWLLQHPSVFTLGLNAKREHLLAPGDIPVVATDRGGQVTYHGPGQLIVYVLMDVRRRQLNTRALVQVLERVIIEFLQERAVAAHARRDAPGVYIGEAKIAALGLRVRQQGSYHGLSVNIAMDLNPFARINPCGYANLPVTQLADWVNPLPLWPDLEREIVGRLAALLEYAQIETEIASSL